MPGNLAGDDGKQVAQLLAESPGAQQHAPSWSTGSTLYYTRTAAGCTPGPTCAEEVHLASFSADDDGTGFGDALSFAGDVVAATGFTDIRDLDADPQDARVVFVATGGDVAVAGPQGVTRLSPTIDVTGLAFTGDGNRLVGMGTRDGVSVLQTWNRDGTPLATVETTALAAAFAEGGGDLAGLVPERAVALSITSGAEGGALDVLLDDPGDADPPILAAVDVSEQGTAVIIGTAAFPVAINQEGSVQAIAR